MKHKIQPARRFISCDNMLIEPHDVTLINDCVSKSER